jgi:hypothetical protein
MRFALPLTLILLGACAAPSAQDPAAAYQQLRDRYARAAAIELEGTLVSGDRETRLSFRAAAPAAGFLEMSSTESVFGETEHVTQRWQGDGKAVYLVNDEARQCAFTAHSWRQLEVLSQLDFLAPAWTLGQAPAQGRVEWGDPIRAGVTVLRVFDVQGGLNREYQIEKGLIVGAQGWDESGDWSFTTEASSLSAVGPNAALAQTLPEGYSVLGTPFDEFNHLRGLLEVGDFAPEITLIDFDGQESTLTEYYGQRVLIAFWFYH